MFCFCVDPPQEYGGRASIDVTLSGLVKSVLAEEENERVDQHYLYTPAKARSATNSVSTLNR